jgi:hypothetical protein
LARRTEVKRLTTLGKMLAWVKNLSKVHFLSIAAHCRVWEKDRAGFVIFLHLCNDPLLGMVEIWVVQLHGEAQCKGARQC